ncbi:DUF1684 domain-containing protein [Geothrix edaphica]|uniref:DUF1684 domain-containing protein n=1 Tax=Geothrix edaphica TaxID=2927976 RepID=A0ABQ5PXK1_9BACT|nr:DUF1684 domain-containing protein [Geothrix edaphica]GLH66839.1 hypothetical protein GETHED_12030 [Geothrix edaphica]
MRIDDVSIILPLRWYDASMLRALALSSACLVLSAIAPPEAAYVQAVDAWHAQRTARLAAEDGWLSLVGLDWLQLGENTLGTAPGSTVLLPAGTAPARAGVFIVDGGTVRVRLVEGCGILVNGQAVVEAALKTDADGQPDLLRAGRIAFYVIRRGSRLGIRMKDPEAPARKAFQGVQRFPVDPAWRVEADFIPHATPQTRAIPTVLGTSEPMTAPGILRFKLKGRTYALEPLIEDPAHPELFIIFRDATSGRETYPAGRFLYAAMPKAGKVILDFNRAYNPPCAFSHFATCPLPPKRNELRVAVRAGEKDYGQH